MAFSLQSSRTLPKPLDFAPKVLRFNKYFHVNRNELSDLMFYHYFKFNDPESSKDMPIQEIPESLIQPEYFLFFGKTSPIDEVTADEVLFLFDRLLPIYEFVEGNAKLTMHKTDWKKGFVFKAGCRPKLHQTTKHSSAAERSMALTHNQIQETLHEILCKQYGEDNVGAEKDSGRGSRVDLIVREGGKYRYYEIKTNPSVRACIREAISQLLEYSYWPGGNEAGKLIIVSENLLADDAARYIGMFRKRFRLPLFYQHIDLRTKTLSAPQ